MGFEKFTAVGQSFAAKASINPRGSISFTRGARMKYKLDDYSFAVLYYDPDEQLVGIEFSRDGDQEGALKIRLRDFGADIGAKSFLDYYNLPIRQTTSFPIKPWEGKAGVILDLNNGVERKSSKEDDE